MNHVDLLNQMGSSITLIDNIAYINGVKKLRGMTLVGLDLRSSAALIIAALTSKSVSYVYGLEHLDRGYENFEQKLSKKYPKSPKICPKYQKLFLQKHVFASRGASGLSKSSRACNLNSGVQILSFVGARSVELRPFYIFYHHFSTFLDYSGIVPRWF